MSFCPQLRRELQDATSLGGRCRAGEVFPCALECPTTELRVVFAAAGLVQNTFSAMMVLVPATLGAFNFAEDPQEDSSDSSAWKQKVVSALSCLP